MDVWFCREQGPPAERHRCVRNILIRSNARSPERATETCAFLLTLTYMEVANPEVTRFWCYFRVEGYSTAIREKT